eukprot:1156607-Pelagomonas_calceolata.AAC.4
MRSTAVFPLSTPIAACHGGMSKPASRFAHAWNTCNRKQVWAHLPWGLDHVEQGVRHLLTVNDHVPTEKPVAGMLAIGLQN